jgi:2-methylcitrate dehydratase PrpD
MDPVKMSDRVIAAVQDKVVFDPSPEPLPDRFPHRHGGTVRVRLKDGREFSSTCRAPRGSGPRGVEWADIDAKYRQLAPMAGLDRHRVESSLATIKNLQDIGNFRDLTASLIVGP